MSEAESKRQADVHLMICHPVESAVLLLDTGSGWALPQMKMEDYVWIRPETALNEWVQAQWGMPTITLNCADRMVDRDKHYEEAVFVLEARGVEKLPEDGRFLTQSDLATATLARPEHRKVLEAYLNELESGVVSSLRPLWLRRGWFDRASAWMTAELERLGYTVTGPVEQLSNWVISSVLRVQTAAGPVYMKAVPDWPLFVHEPLFLAGMARLCPANVPAPLSIESAERWMLLGDFGAVVGRDAPVERLVEMVRVYVQLQVSVAEHVAVLFEVGCIDRRLGRLAVQLDELLADEAALEGLEVEEIGRLHEAAPRLKAICAELAAYRVPQTLMHGDLHLDNVASPNGRMLFFDWTDACIAHPFLDMMVIFEEPDEVKRAQLRDVYLEQWTVYEPMEPLLEAWGLAESLWALHQAVSYQTIMANLEEVPKMGFRNVIPAYLREVLKSVGSGVAE